jgi:dephospho-CoA kinase
VHLFGLTGGIASGKSAVGRRLAARGVPVLDADVLAREVVEKGTEGLAAVVAAFGPSVLGDDGALARKKVAALVFADPARRKELERILHPRISALTMTRAAALFAAGETLVCYEAALLVENGLANAFRPLVVVAAPEAVQLARAAARDGAEEAEVRARIRAQMPLEAKVAVADFVVQNDGTLEDLEARTDEVLAALCERLGVDGTRYPVPARTGPSGKLGSG